MATPTEKTELDAASKAIEAFQASVGAGENGGIKVWSTAKVNGTRPYIGLRQVPNNDFDAFLEELRQDYPEGGEFYLTLIDRSGKNIDNKTIEIAPIPLRLRQTTAPVKKETTMDPMLTMLFNEQRRSEERMAEAQRRADERDARRFELMLGAAQIIVPAVMTVFKGGRGENMGELLNQIIDANQKMRPQEGEDVFDRTLDRMTKLQALTGGAGGEGGGGGLAGLATTFLPAFLDMVNKAPAAAPQQPQQSAPPRPAMPPHLAQMPAPMAQPAPAPQTPAPVSDSAAAVSPDMAAQIALFQRFQPMMSGLKALLAKNRGPDTLADYIGLQVDTGALRGEELNGLLAGLNAEPTRYRLTLGAYGITDDEELIILAAAIAILARERDAGAYAWRLQQYGIATDGDNAALVEECATIIAERLDDTDESGGLAGDAPGAPDHGADVGTGERDAGSAA